MVMFFLGKIIILEISSKNNNNIKFQGMLVTALSALHGLCHLMVMTLFSVRPMTGFHFPFLTKKCSKAENRGAYGAHLFVFLILCMF